jgi:hypothetical protein
VPGECVAIQEVVIEAGAKPFVKLVERDEIVEEWRDAPAVRTPDAIRGEGVDHHEEDVRTQDLSRLFLSNATGFVLKFGAKCPDGRAGQREQHPEIALVREVKEHGTGEVGE